MSACLALAPGALARGAGRYVQRNLVSDQAGQGPASRPEPGQRMGPCLRPDDSGLGRQQRIRQLDPLLGRGERHAGGEAAADGLDPGRGADRNGLQRLLWLRRPLRSELGAGHLPVLVGSRQDHRLEHRRAAARPRRSRRPRSGARSSRAWRSPTRPTASGSTRPTSTTARWTSGTPASSGSTAAAPSRDRKIPEQVRPVRDPGDRPEGLRQLREAGSRRRGRRPGPRQRLRRRLRHQREAAAPVRPPGPLNSPWGIVRAPGDFGGAGGALLIGNFGDGRINAFAPRSGKFLGALRAQERQAAGDRRALGAELRQRDHRHSRHPAVHRGARR